MLLGSVRVRGLVCRCLLLSVVVSTPTHALSSHSNPPDVPAHILLAWRHIPRGCILPPRAAGVGSIAGVERRRGRGLAAPIDSVRVEWWTGIPGGLELILAYWYVLVRSVYRRGAYLHMVGAPAVLKAALQSSLCSPAVRMPAAGGSSASCLYLLYLLHS